MWRSMVNVSALGAEDHEFESHRSELKVFFWKNG